MATQVTYLSHRNTPVTNIGPSHQSWPGPQPHPDQSNAFMWLNIITYRLGMHQYPYQHWIPCSYTCAHNHKSANWEQWGAMSRYFKVDDVDNSKVDCKLCSASCQDEGWKWVLSTQKNNTMGRPKSFPKVANSYSQLLSKLWQKCRH